ncbi:hypothetical protein C8R45DRAFT_789600, partial [Mycena sanguinolenta]
EDLLSDFHQVPYTEEIETALRPHATQLQALLDDPLENHQHIPAAELALANQTATGIMSEALRAGGVTSAGELSIVDRAGVSNWFYNNIPGAKDPISLVRWLGRVPIAHAYTILIASRNHNSIADFIHRTPEYGRMDRQVAVFKVAWHYQRSRRRFAYADVDKECLGDFEERLFEYSEQTGQAGNQQWGLDVGPHQGGWNPYDNLPRHWDHEDRPEESESELQVGFT